MTSGADRVRATVVGSSNVDTVIRSPHVPLEGETLTARSVVRGPGGKGANQAVALARLGADVRFVTAVGDDPDADLLLGTFADEGISTAAVTRSQRATGTATVIVGDDGANVIVVDPGANADVHVAAPIEADVALFQMEIPEAAVRAGIERLRDTTTDVVLNAAPAAPVPDELLALVDVLVINEHEARAITGREDPAAAAEQLRTRIRKIAVVTLGSRGGLLVADRLERWDAVPVDVVDTTGAGDCFVAAFADAHARGLAPHAAAVRAARAAALSVGVPGAQAGMPTAAELD